MAQIVIADATPKVQYAIGGTPSTGPFAITFPYFANADIKVYFDAVLKTETTHYTIAGTAVDDGFSGGNVTLASAESNITVTIQRDIPVARTTDFPVGPFNIATLNKDLDKLYAIGQQLESLPYFKLADSDATGASTIVPTPAANGVLSWNSAANALENSVTTTQISGASASATAAASSATAAASSATAASSSQTAAASSATAAASSSSDATTNGAAQVTLATAQVALATTAKNAAEAAAGAVAWKYTFDSSTVSADPGTGDVRLNHATLASVTSIIIDAQTADTGNPDVSDLIASIDDGTNSTHEGYIFIRKQGTPGTFMAYSVTGAITDSTTHLTIPVTHSASAGSLTNADTLYISFSRSGNVGATGPQGTQGTQGIQGATGATGPIGPVGIGLSLALGG